MFQRNGFSQIELLAVLCILGIVSALAVPSFSSAIHRQKAASVIQTLYHHLNFARSEAISKNIPVSICAANHDMQCIKSNDWSNRTIIIFTDHNGNGMFDSNDQLSRSFNLGLQKNSLKWLSFGNKTYLQWQPSGLTNYQNGNFTYCPDSKNLAYAKRIILNATGRIYMGYDQNRDGIQEGADGKNIECPS